MLNQCLLPNLIDGFPVSTPHYSRSVLSYDALQINRITRTTYSYPNNNPLKPTNDNHSMGLLQYLQRFRC